MPAPTQTLDILIAMTIGEIVGGIFFLSIGVLSIICNKPAAREYAETWGKGLKHGYALGRFITLGGGIVCLLLAALMFFVPRH